MEGGKYMWIKLRFGISIFIVVAIILTILGDPQTAFSLELAPGGI